MDKDKMLSFISKIKDPKKRRILEEKLEAIQKRSNNKNSDKRKGGSGMLQDVFNYNLKGHIKVDQIDKEGNIINNLVDKDNLVVNGADEIVLRALSGDSGRMIFKNRTAKGGSQEVFISSHKLNGKNIIESGKVIHDPSILWSEANDELFDVEYAYYPNSVFIEEIPSGEAGLHKFIVYNTHAPSRVPLGAEVYSSYTNTFIGLGEGKGKQVELDKLKVTKNQESDVDQSKEEIVLNKENASIEFKVKGTRVDFSFEHGKNGGNVEILVNNDSKEVVKLGNKALSDPETQVFELTGLPHDEEVTVKLVHKGAEAGITAPVIKIKAISTDELSKSMNKMFKEFEAIKTKFDTNIYLNTTPEAPFIVNIPHHPVKEETLKISHRNKKFTAAKELKNLGANEYFYDKLTGQLHFHSALTDIAASYEITGEVAEVADQGNLTTETLIYQDVQTQPLEINKPIAVPTAINPLFNIGNTNVHREELVVSVNGSPVDDSDIITFNGLNGTFRLAQFISSNPVGSAITVTFKYDIITPIPVDVYKFTAKHEIDKETFTLKKDDGRNIVEAEDILSLKSASFMFDKDITNTAGVVTHTADPKVVYISKEMVEDAQDEEDKINVVYMRYVTPEFKGHKTNYKRALIEKPKSDQKYPWFQFDTGSIRFVAQFHENDILENLTIREMGLFDGPKSDDGFEGYNDFAVKAFSLVRIPETVKNITTGIQVTWTITLLDEKNNHYKGGNN